MRVSAVAVLMILTTVFLSGCEMQQEASVEDRGHDYYGGGQNRFASYADKNTYQDAAVVGVDTADLAAPSASPVAPSEASAKGAAAPFHSSSAPFHRQAATSMAVPFAHAKESDLVEAGIKPASSANSESQAQGRADAVWQWPVEGKILESFGPQGNGVMHEGITIAAGEGTPIHAALDGDVAYVGSNVPNYGNMVILRHANGDMTAYSYARNIVVTKGMHVAAGTIIAYVGQTGAAKSPQLHFAVRAGNRAVDPLSKLPPQSS